MGILGILIPNFERKMDMREKKTKIAKKPPRTAAKMIVVLKILFDLAS